MSVAVIGGTGLDRLAGLELDRRQVVETPFGEPSAALSEGRLDGARVLFLARHGDEHRLPPHRINYRANLWALRAAGATHVVAVAAVGGIRADLAPGRIAVPHDLIDYTWGRLHTFSDDGETDLQHVDFTQPYSQAVRRALLDAAARAGVEAAEHAVHAVTQGPRLESAAEIARLARDGCDLVGMTGMPEAALARELGLAYGCLAVVVNRAAGIGREGIHAEIGASLKTGMGHVRRLLPGALQTLAG